MLTTTHFTILLNGGATGYFNGGRGLRQGDLLSAPLFVLTMEHLSQVLKIAIAMPSFKHHLGYKQHDLVHLMFADDLMLLSVADVRSVQYIMDAFQEFLVTTGLTTNYNKSTIVLRGCSQQTEVEILQIAGFTIGSLPLRYLGVPNTASKLSKLNIGA